MASLLRKNDIEEQKYPPSYTKPNEELRGYIKECHIAKQKKEVCLKLCNYVWQHKGILLQE